MRESASMDIYVRRKGVDEATVSLERLSRTAGKAEEQAKKLGYFFDKQGRLRHSNGQFAKSNDEVANSLRKLAKETKQASQANDELSGSVANTGTAMEAAKKVAAGYFTFSFVKNAIVMADAMTSMNAQIRLVTASQDEAAIVQERLLSISNRTYSSLEATTTLYTRTARALKDANKSQAEFLTFSEAINNAMRLGGVGANEQTNALLQLSQALGSGVLQGDEFRSIAENAPILLDLVAKELGVVRGEVKALASEGKITSEVIFNALTNASAQLAKDAVTMPITVAQAVNVVKNELNIFADVMLNGTGVTSYMADAIILLSKNVNMVLIPAIGVGAVMAVRALASSLVSLGMVGGPIAAAVSMLGLLAVAWDRNSRKIETLKGKIDQAHQGLSTMTAAQLDAHNLEIEIAISNEHKEFYDLRQEITDTEKDIERLQKLVSKGGIFDSKGRRSNIDALSQELIRLKGKYDDVGESIIALQDIRKNTTIEIGKRNSSSPLSGTQDEVKYSNEYLKVLGEIEKKKVAIGLKSESQIFNAKVLSGEIKLANDEERIALVAKMEANELLTLQAKNTQTVAELMGELRVQAQKAGMGMREAFLFDIASRGADWGQIQEAVLLLEHIATYSPKSGGKSTIDHYNDRLQDMSRELSQVLSLNRELETTGYTSQYNAVSQITLELNDQASTLYKISDAQKQVLIGQAQQIDAANQLNAIMSLGTDYTKRIEDLAFENELMGKSAQQVEAMRFAYELEQQAKLLSIGMSKENILVLEQEIQKQKERYGLAMQEKALKDDSYTEGIKKGFNDYIAGVGTVREQTAGAITMTFGHLEDSLVGFAQNSKFSFSEMTTSILNDLSRILIRMGMMNMVVAGFGENGTGGAIGGLFKKWGWFADGGYTGHGGVYEPAGIVHKGEIVWSQKDIAKFGGISAVESLRTKGLGRGYANGGVVGSAPSSVPSFPRSRTPQPSSDPINISVVVNTEDGTVETNEAEISAKLKRDVVVIVDQRVKEHKRSGGGLN